MPMPRLHATILDRNVDSAEERGMKSCLLCAHFDVVHLDGLRYQLRCCHHERVTKMVDRMNLAYYWRAEQNAYCCLDYRGLV